MDMAQERIEKKNNTYPVYNSLRWLGYSVLLPAAPTVVVWYGGTRLLGSVQWNEFDFFGDFLIVISGIIITAMEYFNSKTSKCKNPWINIPRVFILLTYASCCFWYYGLYAKEGISNPEMKQYVSDNIEKLTYLRNIHIVLLAIVLLLVFVLRIYNIIKEVKSSEKPSEESN